METIIRELVAYGDTLDISGFDLVTGLINDDLSPEMAQHVRTIIGDTPPEDILISMGGPDDCMANE
jgi:hypothetical protein